MRFFFELLLIYSIWFIDFLFQNDMLSWLLEIAEGEQRTSYALTQRLLTLNFAAIHTSSMVRKIPSMNRTIKSVTGYSY